MNLYYGVFFSLDTVMLSNGGYRIYQYIIIQIYLQLSTYMYIEIVCQIAMLYDDNTIFSDCFFLRGGGKGEVLKVLPSI